MKAHRRFWENWMNHQQNRVWRQSSVECWLIWRMLIHMVRKLCVKLKHSIDMGNHSSFIAAQTIIWFLSRDGWIFLIHFFDVGLCANILFLVHYWLTRLNHTHTQKEKQLSTFPSKTNFHDSDCNNFSLIWEFGFWFLHVYWSVEYWAVNRNSGVITLYILNFLSW